MGLSMELQCRFLWGAIAMLTATCRDATGLLVNRFFLGVAEAPLTSGLTIIVAMWYTRDEQPFRQSIWYLGGSVGTLIGSFVGLGVHNIQMIAAWKVCYCRAICKKKSASHC